MAAISNDLSDWVMLMILPTDLPDGPDGWLHEMEHYLYTIIISPGVEGGTWKKLALRYRHYRASSTIEPRMGCYGG